MRSNRQICCKEPLTQIHTQIHTDSDSKSLVGSREHNFINEETVDFLSQFQFLVCLTYGEWMRGYDMKTGKHLRRASYPHSQLISAEVAPRITIQCSSRGLFFMRISLHPHLVERLI